MSEKNETVFIFYKYKLLQRRLIQNAVSTVLCPIVDILYLQRKDMTAQDRGCFLSG